MSAQFNIVIVGHVDHGKSTVIGRLLVDTQSLPEGKLELVKNICLRNAKPFEYAFLLDALKEEQAQGITIDSTRIFFKTPARDYIIIDAPGHLEFLKNMVSGASRADAALVVIDARDGIKDNSKRHAYMLSLLGVRQIAVLINKMDLQQYDAEVFARLKSEFAAFLGQMGIRASHFIPTSGFNGENLRARSPHMPWYTGPTVLEALDSFSSPADLSHQPFRMPVQGVYKFTKSDDQRRIIAGAVAAGSLTVGDTVMIQPSGKQGRVKSFEAFHALAPETVGPGQSVGFTLEEPLFVTRGEVVTRAAEPQPLVGTRLRTSLFWLGERPLCRGANYVLKSQSFCGAVQVENIRKVLDTASLELQDRAEVVNPCSAAECDLLLATPMAFDIGTRFVLVEDYEIAGGGCVLEKPESKDAGEARSTIVLKDLTPEELTALKALLPPDKIRQLEC